MPAPAMPATMRGDGRGTKLPVKKPVGRYFAGKGADASDHSGSESETEELDTHQSTNGPVDNDTTSTKPAINLKQVDLQKHYEQERILEAQRIELEAAAGGDDGGESIDEYETDDGEDESEEEEEEEQERPRRVLMKPTFISKSQRDQAKPSETSSITATDTTAVAARPTEELDDVQKRRLQARLLLEEETRHRATLTLASTTEDESRIDDRDNSDEEETDRAAWKLRELLRIKRDRDALQAREREREEIDVRRKQPEDQRYQEDVDRVAREREEKVLARREERELVGAHERYHHRGGFYQDDPVVKRAVTGKVEDTQAGQGVRGAKASRWNGLVQQDTTGRDSIWSDARDPGVKRTVEKMGGMKDQFNPQKKKRT